MIRIRVVDVPATATAAEVESLLNSSELENYYLDRLVQNGLPEGIGTRGFFRLRVKG